VWVELPCTGKGHQDLELGEISAPKSAVHTTPYTRKMPIQALNTVATAVQFTKFQHTEDDANILQQQIMNEIITCCLADQSLNQSPEMMTDQQTKTKSLSAMC
jgi:hypothetical protein